MVLAGVVDNHEPQPAKAVFQKDATHSREEQEETLVHLPFVPFLELFVYVHRPLS